MARVRFTNPANGAIYDFQRNPTEEDPQSKTRPINRTAPTGSVGAVKQQGDEGPFIIGIRGKIMHRAQYQAMWLLYNLCRFQTVYYADYEGATYEVQITSLTTTRVRKLAVIAPDPGMRHYYYDYTLVMEVYRFISGDLAGVGMVP